MSRFVQVKALSESQRGSSNEESNLPLDKPQPYGVSEALLGANVKRPPYVLIASGAGLYLAGLVAAVIIDVSPPPVTLEAPMEMVYEEQQEPVEDNKQPDQVPTVEKEPEHVEEAEAIEPLKQPEPISKPLKEVQKQPPSKPKAEAKPKPVSAANHIPNAIPSDYASLVFQRINRVASGNYPRSALLAQQSARVGYVIVIGQSGELLSKSINYSGNSALDEAVTQALSRAAPFPAPPNLGARSYRISGAIVYRLQ
jgi:protein TonB